ncbi:MAG: DUF502 domain-containing protein [Saprospiraceae bacterium]|nr:DUF502 domain-containing protein [Saprospiraceae bacterium]
MSRLRNFVITTLIGGFLVLLPLAIFILTIKLLLGLVVGLLAPLTNLIINEFDLPIPDFLVSLIAFTIIIILCFIIGLAVKTQIGRRSFRHVEKTYLLRLPLYGVIKETVQQFTGAKKMPFSDVVLVDVFGNGTRMTGFITDEHDSGNITVFVPTGPNPTNGFIFHVRENQIERLDQDVKTDDALRTIIGVGVGSAKIMKY